jgi:uracil phosphoribosyltransferase
VVAFRNVLRFSGTGNTVIKAVEVLKQHDVNEENIIILNLFCTPIGETPSTSVLKNHQ